MQKKQERGVLGIKNFNDFLTEDWWKEVISVIEKKDEAIDKKIKKIVKKKEKEKEEKKKFLRRIDGIRKTFFHGNKYVL